MQMAINAADERFHYIQVLQEPILNNAPAIFHLQQEIHHNIMQVIIACFDLLLRISFHLCYLILVDINAPSTSNARAPVPAKKVAVTKQVPTIYKKRLYSAFNETHTQSCRSCCKFTIILL